MSAIKERQIVFDSIVAKDIYLLLKLWLQNCDGLLLFMAIFVAALLVLEGFPCLHFYSVKFS